MVFIPIKCLATEGEKTEEGVKSFINFLQYRSDIFVKICHYQIRKFLLRLEKKSYKEYNKFYLWILCNERFEQTIQSGFQDHNLKNLR